MPYGLPVRSIGYWAGALARGAGARAAARDRRARRRAARAAPARDPARRGRVRHDAAADRRPAGARRRPLAACATGCRPASSSRSGRPASGGEVRLADVSIARDEGGAALPAPPSCAGRRRDPALPGHGRARAGAALLVEQTGERPMWRGRRIALRDGQRLELRMSGQPIGFVYRNLVFGEDEPRRVGGVPARDQVLRRPVRCREARAPRPGRRVRRGARDGLHAPAREPRVLARLLHRGRGGDARLAPRAPRAVGRGTSTAHRVALGERECAQPEVYLSVRLPDGGDASPCSRARSTPGCGRSAGSSASTTRAASRGAGSRRCFAKQAQLQGRLLDYVDAEPRIVTSSSGSSGGRSPRPRRARARRAVPAAGARRRGGRGGGRTALRAARGRPPAAVRRAR